uniref:Zgc:194887 n=1 Tax=Sinocyclocheilus rhinocerous TaxID=307959 RepID=A0A673HQL1_9TELE
DSPIAVYCFPRDCYDLWQSSGGQAWDGLYLIRPGDAPIAIYCAMQEGGWMVVQHNTVNSSMDFDRGWDEYKRGFGSLRGNHWLENEHLHRLTRGPARYKLGIMLVDEDAVTKTGEYELALVEDVEAQYRLRLGLFQGTAADTLTLDTDNYLHDNQRFTTTVNVINWQKDCNKEHLCKYSVNRVMNQWIYESVKSVICHESLESINRVINQ